jgi:hypothetical protein
MGARTGRSTETALELLTEQVRTIWSSRKNVATLLSLDIAGAFDTVNPIRLLDILRKSNLPPWIVRWTRAFITSRSTTLVIQGHETQEFQVEAGVPQGSPLSPILFLFYIAELLQLCNRPKEGLSAIGFADDVNLLVYSQSTEANCCKLESTYKKLVEWASKHGMRFAPQKYELIHFARSRRFNLQAGIHLNGVEKSPTKEVRVLGVWLDPKLQWTAHWKQIEKKAMSQIGALVRTTASTWGASFLRARQVYSAVVRPALAYGAAAWHTPAKDRKPQGLAAKLQRTQNKCLRAITGAYRATPARSLETEAHIPLIDLYLDSRCAAFQDRLAGSEVGQIIQKACKAIQTRIKNRKGRKAKDRTPAWGQGRAWAERRKQEIQSNCPTQQTATEKQKVLAAWKSRWLAQEAQRRGKPDY